MTNRKFTPPTEFPAEYVDGFGCKVTILGRSYYNKERPLVGFDDEGCACNYAENGAYWPDDGGKYDLHDIQKRITTWHNVYLTWISPQRSTRSDADLGDHSEGYLAEERFCVYRIERDEGGGNPKIFEEEV